MWRDAEVDCAVFDRFVDARIHSADQHVVDPEAGEETVDASFHPSDQVVDVVAAAVRWKEVEEEVEGLSVRPSR